VRRGPRDLSDALKAWTRRETPLQLSLIKHSNPYRTITRLVHCDEFHPICGGIGDLDLAKGIIMTKQVPFTPGSEPLAESQESAQKARDDGDSLYKVILVPIDFSEHSDRTLKYATRIAARENANIRLLHVFRIPDYAVTQYGRRPHDCGEMRWQAESAEQEAQENLNAVEKEVLSKGIKVKAYFRVGYPLEEIVSMASDPEVDLVIIGSHGLSAIKRLLLGSTAERVVEHARCPVLVVKDRSPGG